MAQDPRKVFDLTEAAVKLPQVMSLQVRGMFGYANDFGRTQIGHVGLGSYQPYAGIYSKKKTPKGSKIVRMRLYGPKNPRTVAQQAWRAVFAAGRAAWAVLTGDQKRAYNERARASRMTGFNLHMREYLSAHRL